MLLFMFTKQLFCILSTQYLYFKAGIKTIRTSLYVVASSGHVSTTSSCHAIKAFRLHDLLHRDMLS